MVGRCAPPKTEPWRARGAAAFARRDWRDAYEALEHADAEEPLDADTREALADAAYLCDDDERFLACLERAHQQHYEHDVL